MRIRKEHALGLEEARRRVDALAGDLQAKYSLRSAWDGDHLNVNGSGVNGHIAVHDQAVEVDVKLGFSLMMLEGAIRSSIEDAMNKHLA